jgi:hypothetical protein
MKTETPQFAVVRHDHISGHSYTVVRLVDVAGTTYGLTVNPDKPDDAARSWRTYSRKPDAFKAARKLGIVSRDLMRETFSHTVMHALKTA